MSTIEEARAKAERAEQLAKEARDLERQARQEEEAARIKEVRDRSNTNREAIEEGIRSALLAIDPKATFDGQRAYEEHEVEVEVRERSTGSTWSRKPSGIFDITVERWRRHARRFPARKNGHDFAAIAAYIMSIRKDKVDSALIAQNMREIRDLNEPVAKRLLELTGAADFHVKPSERTEGAARFRIDMDFELNERDFERFAAAYKSMLDIVRQK